MGPDSGCWRNVGTEFPRIGRKVGRARIDQSLLTQKKKKKEEIHKGTRQGASFGIIGQARELPCWYKCFASASRSRKRKASSFQRRCAVFPAFRHAATERVQQSRGRERAREDESAVDTVSVADRHRRVYSRKSESQVARRRASMAERIVSASLPQIINIRGRVTVIFYGRTGARLATLRPASELSAALPHFSPSS